MRDRRPSLWIGGILGVVAAVVLTWVLRLGSQTLLTGVRLTDSGGVTAGAWLLVLGGVVLGGVMWSARIHPFITGVPAVWFLVRFAPTLVGVPGTPEWYPQWIGRHVLVDLDAAAFIVTGLLSTATALAFVRPRSPQGSAARGG